MFYYINKFRAQILICAIVFMVSNTKGQTRKPERVIADFLTKFLAPFLRSTKVVQYPSDNSTSRKSTDGLTTANETKITKLIKRKIKELKPVLQDDDEMIETEDNLTLYGNKETLVEFLPKTLRKADKGIPVMVPSSTKPDSLKENINKYKTLREQIKTLLDEEKITDQTKSLILTTLDEMISMLIESQCNWIPGEKIQNTNLNESISSLESMSKKQWKNLRSRYMNYLVNREEKENAFMNEFNNFFYIVINDTDNLKERYKIRCQLVQTHNGKDKKPSLREDKNEKIKCKNFKLCSEEIKAFFHDLYNYINDTGVSVFTNYASMYVRDVNVDFGINKNVVVEILNNLGKKAELKVMKIYSKELKSFKLDPIKNKNANVKNIKQFIKTVVYLIENSLKDILKKELGAMKTKLFMTVKEDISVNLHLDMANLQRHYIDEVCTTFVLCNGRYSTRRVGEPAIFKPKTDSDVFVKVQLSLDDEMRNAVAKSGLLRYFENPNHSKYRLQNKMAKPNIQPRSHLNISVTRTSINIPTVITTEVTLKTSVSGIKNEITEKISSRTPLPN